MNAILFGRVVIGGVVWFLLVSVAANISANAGSPATAKAIAKAYQQNYIGQKNLPEDATPAQRSKVERAAFKDANAQVQKEILRQQSVMNATSAKILQGINDKAKENRAIREKLGLDGPEDGKEGKDKNDFFQRKKALVERLIKEGKLPPGTGANLSLKQLLAAMGGKGVASAGGAGGKGGVGVGGGKGGPVAPGGTGTVRSATEVTGSEGAKKVDFGKEKELKMQDGIIQDK